MITSWVQKIKSPWTVTALSILISEIIFVAISIFFNGTVSPFGIILSFIIPACSAYPVSSIMLKYHAKIEEQKNELEHLDKVNKRLFTTISHDIKSPLANVLGLMELIAGNTISVKEAQSHLNDLNTSVKVLLRFLDDLLTWSRLQIDKNPLNPEPLDTKEILTQSLDLYRNIISQKEITLIKGALSGNVLVDKGSFSFVVRNILQNAIKYTPRGGTIEIQVHENKDRVYTTIRDTGVGINEEKIARIKSKTSYLSSKGTNEEVGTGFGLRTAIEYLESQNGILDIQSEKNIGTTVSVSLPKVP